MATTIQISNTLQDALVHRKLSDRESYENVIWDLIEDSKEINDQTKKDIEESRKEYNAGKVHSLAHVKNQLGL